MAHSSASSLNAPADRFAGQSLAGDFSLPAPIDQRAYRRPLKPARRAWRFPSPPAPIHGETSAVSWRSREGRSCPSLRTLPDRTSSPLDRDRKAYAALGTLHQAFAPGHDREISALPWTPSPRSVPAPSNPASPQRPTVGRLNAILFPADCARLYSLFRAMMTRI